MHHGWGRGVGYEGLVDPRLLVPVGVLWWRWGLFWDQAPSKHSSATNKALHRSSLQWVASHCNGKGNRYAEFVPLPLFFCENVVSYSETEGLAENASVHLQVLPLGVPGFGGESLPLIVPNKQTFQQRMQGGYHGRGYLIPERKKVQRCE